jgi:hypothetical protein
MRAWSQFAALLLWAGCGTTGDAGGGAANLPVSGGGPFAPLKPNPAYLISAPTVLLDPTADLEYPVVLADGNRLTAWLTARRAGSTQTTIGRTELTTLGNGFSDLAPALAADQPWEGGAVAGPSVLPGAPWLLFYGASGAIGYATSPDGRAWQKATGPTLTADPRLDGADALGPPAAVRVDDRVIVYYPAGGQLWAASALVSELVAGAAVHWQRLNGTPAVEGRHPMVAAAQVPFGVALGRVFARAANTPAGRRRYDLYFTVETGQDPVNGVVTTCGFASSQSGFDFAAEAVPILPPGVTTHAPTMTPYESGALLLYIGVAGVRQALDAAKSP